ncbi:MOSC domain-containing protein [Aquincola sp. S2]|uniref:MOSC domain-containing protein n=1 Tax=Pseudaquabacterium terrae TaxID=2732868 RepID=A0ABX2ELP5_9BURK|nr:MOSC domain-containing protein [Aquabacterium terrae]NRF69574.1 MOSC domain-containing protein [Aquabacterium terrae]
MPIPLRVLSVNRALATTMMIQGQPVQTGIRKQAVAGPVELRPLGLQGDEQADLTVHGGLSKAVYAYPAEHYPFWQTVRAQARAAVPGEPLPPGALGENLTIEGLAEDQLWIGDRLRLPNCELAVSEPRYPCFKFNAVMGFAQAAKLMSQSGYCGSYLAVINPGTIEAGDAIELIPGPREVNVRELFKARMGKAAAKAAD